MKNKKKGFTLVELIVVLAILAILAAMLVPALTGYIDKANAQKVVATTRQVVMAAQSEVTEEYSNSSSAKLTEATINKDSTDNESAKNKTLFDDICKLAEVSLNKNGVTDIQITFSEKGVVTKVVVKQSGKTCTYDVNASNGGYTVS